MDVHTTYTGDPKRSAERVKSCMMYRSAWGPSLLLEYTSLRQFIVWTWGKSTFWFDSSCVSVRHDISCRSFMTWWNKGPPNWEERIPVANAGSPAERRVRVDAVSNINFLASYIDCISQAPSVVNWHLPGTIFQEGMRWTSLLTCHIVRNRW